MSFNIRNKLGMPFIIVIIENELQSEMNMIKLINKNLQVEN